MHAATSFLFGLSPDNPAVFVLATALLLLASALAGFIPAWHAARIEPVQALRNE
jgi:putative ABC transport system permease protein